MAAVDDDQPEAQEQEEEQQKKDRQGREQAAALDKVTDNVRRYGAADAQAPPPTPPNARGAVLPSSRSSLSPTLKC